jgi:PKD repeat protein
MEPNGWAIVGLPANFWASASVHTGEGLLLGQPAQVKFTPINFRWNYGDGSVGSSATAGASWTDLGVAEFAETATSHVYNHRGTFTVGLIVGYRADYSFGDQGWRPVEGTVTVSSAPFSVVAATESTVLVAEDCRANPRGPGC